MLNSFFVTCPHIGCDWVGILEPEHAFDEWHGIEPTDSLITFECPSCLQSWQAHVVGEDAEPVPSQALEPMVWPPLDIGVGD